MSGLPLLRSWLVLTLVIGKYPGYPRTRSQFIKTAYCLACSIQEVAQFCARCSIKRCAFVPAYQGCARLMNQRQHDSSYRLLAMNSSPQLQSGTNYTTSTIVPRSNRTHYRQNRTTAYQRHSRSWQAASRAPSSSLWRC